MEAYNSVYNYDLIGLVETHLDITVDEERLSLDGYSLHRNNHPQNIKRGGVGLYVKDSLPSKTRPDFVTVPECIVCEIQVLEQTYEVEDGTKFSRLMRQIQALSNLPSFG